jgi:hypothetical protein
MQLEKRFGTSASSMTLVLKSPNNENIAVMKDDYAIFGLYGVEENFIVHCIDEDPNSILRELEDLEGVEKYIMSDADYDKLPSIIISEYEKV